MISDLSDYKSYFIFSKIDIVPYVLTKLHIC